jgi:hypothetical protein
MGIPSVTARRVRPRLERALKGTRPRGFGREGKESCEYSSHHVLSLILLLAYMGGLEVRAAARDEKEERKRAQISYLRFCKHRDQRHASE